MAKIGSRVLYPLHGNVVASPPARQLFLESVGYARDHVAAFREWDEGLEPLTLERGFCGAWTMSARRSRLDSRKVTQNGRCAFGGLTQAAM